MAGRASGRIGPARGREDVRPLAADRIDDLRQLPYAELRARADGGTQVEDLDGLSGERYRRRTMIKRFPCGGEEELHIKLQVDDGSLLGRLNPLADALPHPSSGG